MAQEPTDATVKNLPSPPTGYGIAYDADVKDFGCQITAKGAKAFILYYRTRAGRERRITIGAASNWRVSAARDEARRLRALIDLGKYAMGELTSEREAKTVADLADKFIEQHLP